MYNEWSNTECLKSILKYGTREQRNSGRPRKRSSRQVRRRNGPIGLLFEEEDLRTSAEIVD
jgi:hypothetical protein